MEQLMFKRRLNMSTSSTMHTMEGGRKVVKSETRTVTQNGVTKTITTEVIESYGSGSMNGSGGTKTVRTVTTENSHSGRKGSFSSTSSNSDNDSKKPNKLHAFMGKMSISNNKKEVKQPSEVHTSPAAHNKESSQKSKGLSMPTITSPFKSKYTKTKSSSDSDSDSDDEDFAKECLKQHNYYRAKHGVANLKLNKSICKYAEEWANKLAREDSFRHRTDHKYGENIYMSFSSNPKHKISGKVPVESWYAEIKDHHCYGSEPRSMGTGHFTQVVWKGSKEFGVGVGKTKNGKIIVVANYDPPGNLLGTYATNVLPPK